MPENTIYLNWNYLKQIFAISEFVRNTSSQFIKLARKKLLHKLNKIAHTLITKLWSHVCTFQVPKIEDSTRWSLLPHIFHTKVYQALHTCSIYIIAIIYATIQCTYLNPNPRAQKNPLILFIEMSYSCPFTRCLIKVNIHLDSQAFFTLPLPLWQVHLMMFRKIHFKQA